MSAPHVNDGWSRRNGAKTNAANAGRWPSAQNLFAAIPAIRHRRGSPAITSGGAKKYPTRPTTSHPPTSTFSVPTASARPKGSSLTAGKVSPNTQARMRADQGVEGPAPRWLRPPDQVAACVIRLRVLRSASAPAGATPVKVVVVDCAWSCTRWHRLQVGSYGDPTENGPIDDVAERHAKCDPQETEESSAHEHERDCTRHPDQLRP